MFDKILQAIDELIPRKELFKREITLTIEISEDEKYNNFLIDYVKKVSKESAILLDNNAFQGQIEKAFVTSVVTPLGLTINLKVK